MQRFAVAAKTAGSLFAPDEPVDFNAWACNCVVNTMNITGFWFEPDSSRRHDSTVQVDDSAYRLHLDGEVIRKGLLQELEVSDRIGDMPRRLTWPDGAQFETANNDAVDEALCAGGHKASQWSLLHGLESHWGWVATALLVTVLVSYLGIRYGLPAASESIARKLPASVNKVVSEQALDALDRIAFAESKSSAERQAEVQRQFDALVETLPDAGVDFTLHFRRMGDIPNAMALPGGDVVVTDAFLELIEHPDELDSVLLHEIGHVLEYHGMTQVIRASAVSVIAALAFGDLSAVGEVATGVPIFMMQNSYSQRAESEADDYAFARMHKLGKDPKHFADIILRLSEQELDEEDTEEQGNYFSSHPDSRGRARKALEASRLMRESP